MSNSSSSSATSFSVAVLAALTFVFAFAVLGFGSELLDTGAIVDVPDTDNVVTITAKGLDFDAPAEIRSGWTTFEFNNVSGMTHFAILERLPEGIGIKDHQTEVAPLFQEGFELLAARKPEAASETFDQLPAWYSGVVFVGGPGFVGPGQTARTTLNVEPGTYLLECYVKTNGVFHSYNPLPTSHGMVREITVTDERTRTSAPTASIELAISANGGIERTDDTILRPGQHTVAVHFKDQAVYKNFVGHDVHLARLAEETDLDTLSGWMDWTQPHGLETPAPVSFLGGTNEMPVGETGYFTVDLTAGRYAWIAEVPNPAEKGMLKPFTVPSGEEFTRREGN